MLCHGLEVDVFDPVSARIDPHLAVRGDVLDDLAHLGIQVLVIRSHGDIGVPRAIHVREAEHEVAIWLHDYRTCKPRTAVAGRPLAQTPGAHHNDGLPHVLHVITCCQAFDELLGDREGATNHGRREPMRRAGKYSLAPVVPRQNHNCCSAGKCARVFPRGAHVHCEKHIDVTLYFQRVLLLVLLFWVCPPPLVILLPIPIYVALLGPVRIHRRRQSRHIVHQNRGAERIVREPV
mmetsp:Transcript_74361/g.195055  ORF Transcript_74361/g.195055 Transcript_74361/m.195055 type:complete len:235 (+) Transcript_74361:1553-2257(+)